MGSCFRWKKKNSYTVSHDAEYTVCGGKYNPHTEPCSIRTVASVPTPASNSAAKKWAAESRDDALTGGTEKPVANDTAVPAAGDHQARDERQTAADHVEEQTARDDAVIKENGYHGGEVHAVNRSGSPSPGSPSTPDLRKPDPDSMQYEDARYEGHPAADRFDTGGDDVRPDSPASDSRYGSPPNITDDIRTDSPLDVATGSPVGVPQITIQTYETGSISEYTDQLERSGEDFVARSQTECEASEGIDVHFEGEGYDDDGQKDEVHINSPTGTWDARLNRDVRAELDDVQRSLEGSKTSSTASLDQRRHDDYQEAVDEVGPAVVQHVQFDIPEGAGVEYEPTGATTPPGETGISISDARYTIGQSTEADDSDVLRSSYETTDGSADREEFDNQVNVVLVETSTTQYGDDGRHDELTDGHGVIELSDEYIISYEDPYSGGGRPVSSGTP